MRVCVDARDTSRLRVDLCSAEGPGRAERPRAKEITACETTSETRHYVCLPRWFGCSCVVASPAAMPSGYHKSGDRRFHRDINLFENWREIRMPKIVPLEQDWLAHRPCKSVGKEAPEFQARLVPAALAEIPIRFARDPRLALRNRLDAHPRFAEEILNPPARNRIPAPVNYGGRLHIIDGRDAAVSCGSNRPRERPSFPLLAEKMQHCRRIHNHRGIPFSSYRNPPVSMDQTSS